MNDRLEATGRTQLLQQAFGCDGILRNCTVVALAQQSSVRRQLLGKSFNIPKVLLLPLWLRTKIVFNATRSKLLHQRRDAKPCRLLVVGEFNVSVKETDWQYRGT